MNRWLRVSGETLHLRRPGEPVGERPTEILTPLEAASAVQGLTADTPDVRADLFRAFDHVLGSFGSPDLRFEDLRSAVAGALRDGELVAYRHTLPDHSELFVDSAPESTKPALVDDETPPDMYVIAPEVRLIGAGVVPLIRHRVRVFDPDTNEIVVDWRTTDDQGVLRAEVPENKKYRIEIADLDLPMQLPPPPAEPLEGLLRCQIVDDTGAPVANEKVAIAHPSGNAWEHVTDDDGRLEVPAWLGHYTLTVRDQDLAAYAVLQRDRDDDASVYHFVIPSTDGSPPVGDPTNRLERTYPAAGAQEPVT